MHAEPTLTRRAALLEGGTIALCSGVFALAAAAPLVRSLNTITGDMIPHLRDFAIDARVAAFATLLITLTGLAVSIRIATERRSLNRRIVRWVTTLGVTAQLGIASLLAVGAVLSIGQLRGAASERLGFNPDHLYVATLFLPGRRYASDASVRRLAPRLTRDLEADGIVDGATVATGVPFSGVQMETGAAPAVHRATPGSTPLYELESVLPNYFAVMHIPLVAGRTFRTDEVGSTRAVIVNKALAQRLFGRRPAIGHSLRLDSDIAAARIVGIVGNVKREAADAAPRPAIYLPRTQLPGPFVTVVVRSDASASTVAAVIRRHVTRLNPRLNVTDARSLARNIAKNRSPLRFAMWLLISSAAFGLGLALCLLTDGVMLAVPRGLAILAGVASGAALAAGLRSFMLSWFPVPQTSPEPIIAIVSLALVAIFFLCSHTGARRARTNSARSREALYG